YVWRHGNREHCTDEFTSSLATPDVKKYIRTVFNKMSQTQNLTHLVEKTCANSLRVSFVDAIFPEAKYIFIVRDGRDVVHSAIKRWTAPLDIPYILKKARFVPVSDLPYYGIKYLLNRIYRLRSGEKRVSSWGPKFEGMTELLKTKTLPEVCAAQWARCVNKSEEDLEVIETDRVFRLRYEDFVSHPTQKLTRLTDFLNIPAKDGLIRKSVATVSPKNIGKWKIGLDETTLEAILPSMISLLRYYHYDI
ncbi:sulfotransferase, partial [bacterium]|nr:sulfotransferase [bacterium]